jgi:hypothetical protein
MSSSDKNALLAAINSAVAAPKTKSKNENTKTAKSLAQGQGVNVRVAHELVSNASKAMEIADQREFQNASHDHKHTLLNKEKLNQMKGAN